ncbi:hypothetical protein VKT23_018668 [Stygiomarasmius scandens]|uniref:Uncharacterized protein n=1 Tax=Marasmiellus scandens TaxID=2682957 RepID=A0ABR1INK9_9AGAR
MKALQTVRPAKRSLPLSPESLYSLPCVKTPSQTKAPSPLSLFSFANAHIYAVLRRPRIDGQSYHLSCHYSQRDLELRPRT